MQTEMEITQEINDLSREYDEQSAEMLENDRRALSSQIKDLKNKRMAMIVQGSDVCEVCASQPLGMKRRRGFYEIGCPQCENHRADGETSAEAVVNWNALSQSV